MSSPVSLHDALPISLDHEPAAIAWRDVERTADGLGADGCAWRSTLGALAANWRTVAQLSLGDKRSIPPGVLDPRALPAAALFGAMVGAQGKIGRASCRGRG